MPLITTDNLFRTWPDRYERLNGNSPSELLPPNGLSLSSALNQMSLAYSPITKKLHQITIKEEEPILSDQKVVEDGCDVSPSVDEVLNDKNELLEEKIPKLGFWNFLRRVSVFKKIERSQKYGFVIASSSGLILNDRPAHLPAKSIDERDRHKTEHQEIIEAAKKKDEETSLKKKRQLSLRLREEDQRATLARIWSREILPKWHQTQKQKRTRELWWQGLPACVRGHVWRLAVGNELGIGLDIWEGCCESAEEKLKKSSNPFTKDCDSGSGMELIKLDIARTFPHLCIFQKGGPYYDILHKLISAYVCYRPDVGYVQGMSFIAAILILNLDALDAFICFANLLNRPCLTAFFTLSQTVMQAYYDTFEELLKINLPRLSSHLISINLTPDLYLMEWVVTVFVKAMPLDISCRVWDVFIRDGEEFIFQTALGILHCFESELFKMDFVNSARFLTRLPDGFSSDSLFKSISGVRMTIGKITFDQLLERHIDRRRKEER